MNDKETQSHSSFPRVAVIIPSLNPTASLLQIIEALEQIGAADIIVVNDGSASAHRHFFEEANMHACVTVLTHETNRGKGAALRTAFSYVLEHCPHVLGAVTVDDDLQHTPRDIMACSAQMCQEEKVILGCRTFEKEGIPKRSLIGNRMTSLAFRLFFGMRIDDTQTGLRAIPRRYLSEMLTVGGDRYEYETNMLLKLRSAAIPYAIAPIETVYHSDVRHSHFRPFRDSMRIFWLLFGRLFKYLCCSVGCLLFETFLQTLLHDFWHLTFDIAIPFLATLCKELCDFLPARLLSSIVNYFLNRKFVFEEKTQSARSLVRYYILWAIQAIITALATAGLNCVLGGTSGLFYFLVTVFVKCVIFLASYTIQKKWVFASPKEKQSTN